MVLFYVVAGSTITLEKVDEVMNGTIYTLFHGVLSSAELSFSCWFIITTVAVTAAIIMLCTTKKHFYIEKAGLNPFKKMYKVLKYSWKHKVPEHRSAFTH